MSDDLDHELALGAEREAALEEVASFDPLVQLQRANEELIAELAGEGGGIHVLDLLKLRIDVAIDMLMPSGGPFRDLYELMYEKNLNELLQRAIHVNRQQKLDPLGRGGR